jgi:hypothetical protein
MLLEDFGNDRDSRIDWVRNYKHESFGRGRRNSGGEITDDSSIDLSVGQAAGRVMKSGNRRGASVSFTCFSIFHSSPEQSGRKQTNLEEILPTM